MRTTEKKIQEKFEIIPKRFEGRSFEGFAPIGYNGSPQGNLELKFERDAFNRFRDNCDTDFEGRRRTTH